MNKRIAATLASALTLGLINESTSGQVPAMRLRTPSRLTHVEVEREGAVDLRAQKEWADARLRPRLFYLNPHVPYVREKTGNEIKGKKNIRAAKRERVRLMKATQTEEAK